jgi:hypothetical protein
MFKDTDEPTADNQIFDISSDVDDTDTPFLSRCGDMGTHQSAET